MTADVSIGALERLGVLTGSRQRTVAAAGSSQTDATLIGANITIVTGTTGANGVVLRAAKQANEPYAAMVYSSAATNALLIYPPSGGTINNGTADAALSLTARKTVILTSVLGSKVNFIANISA